MKVGELAPYIGDPLGDELGALTFGKIELYDDSSVTKIIAETNQQRQLHVNDGIVSMIEELIAPSQLRLYIKRDADSKDFPYQIDVSANFTGYIFRIFYGVTLYGALMAIKYHRDQYLKSGIIYRCAPATWITKAAIKDHNSDHVWTLPRPKRHSDIIHVIAEERGLIDDGVTYYSFTIPQENQGFVTNTGEFVGREDALHIAIAAGQLIGAPRNQNLFSEEVW
jgi:hypothetical protein